MDASTRIVSWTTATTDRRPELPGLLSEIRAGRVRVVSWLEEAVPSVGRLAAWLRGDEAVLAEFRRLIRSELALGNPVVAEAKFPPSRPSKEGGATSEQLWRLQHDLDVTWTMLVPADHELLLSQSAELHVRWSASSGDDRRPWRAHSLGIATLGAALNELSDEPPGLANEIRDRVLGSPLYWIQKGSVTESLTTPALNGTWTLDFHPKGSTSRRRTR